MSTDARWSKASLPDSVIERMSPEDRAAMKLELPADRFARVEQEREKDIQRLCEQELTRRRIPFFHISPKGREKIGWPDLTFPLPFAFAAVELKTATGKVTPEQERTLADLADAGAVVAVCRSFDEFRDFLNQHSRKTNATA